VSGLVLVAPPHPGPLPQGRGRKPDVTTNSVLGRGRKPGVTTNPVLVEREKTGRNHELDLFPLLGERVRERALT